MKFGSLDKMINTSSEPKENLGISLKGLITSMGIKVKARPKKQKKEIYCIGNVSMKDILNIIREFEKLPYKIDGRKSAKHDPTDIYFYLENQIAKCLMRADALNLHIYPIGTEMTEKKHIPISNIFFYGQEQIRRVPSGLNFITGLFYRRGRTKNHYRR